MVRLFLFPILMSDFKTNFLSGFEDQTLDITLSLMCFLSVLVFFFSNWNERMYAAKFRIKHSLE